MFMFCFFVGFILKVGDAVSSSDNLALHRETRQSVFWYDGYSSRPVDGNTDGNYASGSCLTTQGDPWWLVDLRRVYAIQSVVIYNRDDVPSDLSGLGVDIYPRNPIWCNNASYTRCTTSDVGTAPIISFDCGINTRGRYVRLSRDSHWSFCEVEVYGEFLALNDTFWCPTLTPVKIENVALSWFWFHGHYNASLLDCVHLCTKWPTCEGFSYSYATRECIPSVYVYGLSGTSTYDGWDSYLWC